MSITNIIQELESLRKMVHSYIEPSAFYIELDRIATQLLEELQVRDKSDLILFEKVRNFLNQVKVLKNTYGTKLSSEELAILKNMRANININSTKESMIGYMLTRSLF